MFSAKVSRKEKSMTDYESLNHTKWDCKYHIVFIPKYCKKARLLEPFEKEVRFSMS